MRTHAHLMRVNKAKENGSNVHVWQAKSIISRHCLLCDWFAINLAPGRQPITTIWGQFLRNGWGGGGMGNLTINTVFSFQKYVLNFYPSLSRRLLPLSLRVAYLSLELIFWYSTKPAVEGKFCLDAWTIRRVSSYVCSVTGTRKTL